MYCLTQYVNTFIKNVCQLMIKVDRTLLLHLPRRPVSSPCLLPLRTAQMLGCLSRPECWVLIQCWFSAERRSRPQRGNSSGRSENGSGEILLVGSSNNNSCKFYSARAGDIICDRGDQTFTSSFRWKWLSPKTHYIRFLRNTWIFKGNSNFEHVK